MAATPSPVVLTRPPSTSTATKYRNTTTATCYLARLGTALPCSVANMVAVAGSSGRRGLLNEVRRPMITRSRHRRSRGPTAASDARTGTRRPTELAILVCLGRYL